jgi:hypothetical protein
MNLFKIFVAKGLLRPLKIPSGPYESIEPKHVVTNSLTLMPKLSSFRVSLVSSHGSDQSSAVMWADCPIGLCAHMSHIGSAWASASETFADAVEALAMGSERHIFLKGNKVVMVELSSVLKSLDCSHDQFIDMVLHNCKKPTTEANRDYYLSRGLEACPYVLTDFDITFQFEL